MDQTVNLTSSTSVVRIHLCPPLRHTRKERIKLRCVCLFLCKTKVKWKITVFADTVFVVSSHIGAVICFLLTWRNESLDGNRKSRWALYKKDSCTINLLQVYLPLQIVDLYKILSASGCYFVCNLSVLFRSSVHNYNVFVLSACFFWRLRKSPGRFFLKDGRVLAFIIIAGNQRHSDDGSLRWRGDIVCGGFPRDHVVVV